MIILTGEDCSVPARFTTSPIFSYLCNQRIIMTAQEISVNIPPTLDPVYSNMIQIAYKDDEFTFMFLHQLPQVNQARAKAIVSITPSHAKNLLGVLTKTVADYESKFGTIASKENPGKENVTALSGYS
jgi:hypothetical protein